MMSKLALALALAGVSTIPAAAAPFSVFFSPRVETPLAPPLPPTSDYPVQLVLDNDVPAGGVGVIGQSARQFLWFNRFSVAGDFRLEQIWVLFAPEADVTVGSAIQLVVYSDSNQNPADGATVLATYDETIQVVDGATFSIYTLPAALDVPAGDVLIGVVPRFIVSNTTPIVAPARVDSGPSQERSWLAIWNADPPNPPTLPADNTTILLDEQLPGSAGNWLIRGFGTQVPIVEVPVDARALTFFVLLLTLAGAVTLRGRA
jgi:hypothetical protein